MSKEFPDIAFVNVDGQAVPFTKPQHYKKGSTTDTLLTGEDNPLPTKDESVEARLQAIEQTQSQILDKLNDTIDTRLTGSNVEDGLPIKSVGGKVVEKQLLDRKIRNAFTQAFDTNVDPAVKRIVIVLNVYGVTGTFDSGEGYRLSVRKHSRGTIQAYDVARTNYTSSGGNFGGAIITVDPEIGDKVSGDSDNYILAQDALFPSYRIMLFVDGVFGEGEGVDCDVSAYYIY